MKLLTVICAALLVGLAGPGVSNAQENASHDAAEAPGETSSERVEPIPGSDLRPSTVPDDVRESARERVEAKREAMDRAQNGGGTHGKEKDPSADAAGAEAAAQETVADDGAGDAATESLQVRRNFRNTRAAAVSSTLAEPAAANDFGEVFYSGNTYNSYSADHGFSWAARGLHAGPADANIPCCDPDVVHHAPTDTTFSLLLYVNGALTNGVVDIEVRRGSPSTIDCIYRIDPAGANNNILPDYPHMGVTQNFLFLSTNNIRNGAWIGANTRRFNVSQMANCQFASGSSFNYVGSVGQRVHVPGETQQGVTCEYWAQYENATTIRWFQWCDGAASPVSFLRSTVFTNFSNPDCRGGTGNFDFIERSTSWSIAGFRGRTAVGGGRAAFLVNAAQDASHPQAHLHGQAISRSTLGVVQNLAVHNSGSCLGYPALGSNSRDDLGLSVAFGGKKGGFGTAARGYVGVDDSSSVGIHFPTISLTAHGTHNRSDHRWGDYFTVRGNDQCPGAWGATNFSLLNGNTSSSHVNARWVEFQSTSQPSCP